MSELQNMLRQRALAYLMKHNVEVPTKRDVRRGSGTLKHPSVRQDVQELRRHPGDSRSVVLDRIKAINATETGCRAATGSELSRIGQQGVRGGVVRIVRKIGN